MESGYLAILSSKGQLTVPKELRNRLKLVEGQRLFLEEDHGALLIKKASVQEVVDDLEEKEWDELKRLASAKGRIYKTGKTFLKSFKTK